MRSPLPLTLLFALLAVNMGAAPKPETYPGNLIALNVGQSVTFLARGRMDGDHDLVDVSRISPFVFRVEHAVSIRNKEAAPEPQAFTETLGSVLVDLSVTARVTCTTPPAPRDPVGDGSAATLSAYVMVEPRGR